MYHKLNNTICFFKEAKNKCKCTNKLTLQVLIPNLITANVCENHKELSASDLKYLDTVKFLLSRVSEPLSEYQKRIEEQLEKAKDINECAISTKPY